MIPVRLCLCAAICALNVSACQDSGAQTAQAQEDTSAGPVVNLTVDEVAALQANSAIRLIDVRTDQEVATGTIPGAEHIVLDDLVPASFDPDDAREVVFYCRSGRRSTNAAMRLSTYLGKPVRHLEGGMLAWQAAGQPVAVSQ